MIVAIGRRRVGVILHVAVGDWFGFVDVAFEHRQRLVQPIVTVTVTDMAMFVFFFLVIVVVVVGMAREIIVGMIGLRGVQTIREKLVAGFLVLEIEDDREQHTTHR